MKRILLAGTFALSLCVGGLGSSDENIYTTKGMLNGRHWNRISEELDSDSVVWLVKGTYIKGFYDGIFWLNSIGKEPETDEVVNKLGKVPVADLVKAINALFADDANVDFPIPVVVLAEVMRLNGEISEERYAHWLHEMRKTFSK